MFRKYLIGLFIFFCLQHNSICFAQTDSINNVIDFSLDDFGNLYVAKKTSEFIKINSEGKVMRINSRKDLGVPTSINAENPLRILIFYREQGWLIVADNQLAFQFEIDLKRLGLTDPTLVANTFDGGIWVFDRGNGTLNKIMISPTGVQNTGTIDLRQILFTELNPQQLITDGNYVILSNDNTLYIFDRYGTYIRKIELDDITISLNIEETTVNASTKNSVYSCNIRYLSEPTKYAAMKQTAIRKSATTKSKLYELTLGDVLMVSPSKK
jgi:hypothetical protein